ncbi:MAG: hypothetical protein ACKOZZ_04790 [Bacteroidota bacterium]
MSKKCQLLAGYPFTPIPADYKAHSSFRFINDPSQWDQDWFRWHEYGGLESLVG